MNLSEGAMFFKCQRSLFFNLEKPNWLVDVRECKHNLEKASFFNNAIEIVENVLQFLGVGL